MLNRIFHQTDVPKKYQSNFIHLYFDIGWFGILSGSAVNFLNVYAARLGASGTQIGLIAAASAIVNLVIAIPSANWVEKRDTNRAVFWSSVAYRLGYALWIPLPLITNHQLQIWALIAITFLMAIPLTPLGVGFNALFAEAVPTNYRAQVAGTRNVVFAMTYMASSLLSGYLLKSLSFVTGYGLIFAIGFFGAAMSSVHLFFIKPLVDEKTTLQTTPIPAPQPKTDSPRGILATLRIDVIQSPFSRVLILLFCFHLAHYLTNPLYALFNVNVLHLNDNNIGIGTALYYLTVFMGSTQLSRIVRRMGHKKVTGWGVLGMSTYPILLALSSQVWHYYLVSILGGVTWAFAGGAYANYMLEKIPPDDRPSHLAWYNMALNAAILLSSFIGPAIGDGLGLVAALIVFGLMRALAGLAILKWG
ncbi:MAG: MFS transporter [Anaerolineales bacterium]